MITTTTVQSQEPQPQNQFQVVAHGLYNSWKFVASGDEDRKLKARKEVANTLEVSSRDISRSISVKDFYEGIPLQHYWDLPIDTILSIAKEKYLILRDNLMQMPHNKVSIEALQKMVDENVKASKPPKEPRKTFSWKRDRYNNRRAIIELPDCDTARELEADLKDSCLPVPTYIKSLFEKKERCEKAEQVLKEKEAAVAKLEELIKQEPQPSVAYDISENNSSVAEIPILDRKNRYVPLVEVYKNESQRMKQHCKEVFKKYCDAKCKLSAAIAEIKKMKAEIKAAMGSIFINSGSSEIPVSLDRGSLKKTTS
jgi:hypothetical protein